MYYVRATTDRFFLTYLPFYLPGVAASTARYTAVGYTRITRDIQKMLF
jgi:hypothetical protein